MTLLEQLAAALVDVDDVDDFAVLLHDTSCRCTSYDSRTYSMCPDYQSGRYRRWAREIQHEIAERVDLLASETPRSVGAPSRRAGERAGGTALPLPAQRRGTAGTPNTSAHPLEVAA